MKYSEIETRISQKRADPSWRNLREEAIARAHGAIRRHLTMIAELTRQDAWAEGADKAVEAYLICERTAQAFDPVNGLGLFHDGVARILANNDAPFSVERPCGFAYEFCFSLGDCDVEDLEDDPLYYVIGIAAWVLVMLRNGGGYEGPRILPVAEAKTTPREA